MYQGHRDAVQVLLDHGASQTLADDEDRTCVMLALLNNHVDVAKLLIAHRGSVDGKTTNQRTALHMAGAMLDRRSLRARDRH